MADRRVGFALSGGGYRATAWGFGALLGAVGVRDAPGEGERLTVSTIASVSGGSITNGIVAVTCPDLDTLDEAAVLERWSADLHRVAAEGLIFFAKGTNGYVWGLLVAAGITVASLLASVGLSIGAAISGSTTVLRWAFVPAAVGAVALWATLRVASRRGDVVRKALDRVHFSPSGAPVPLASLADRQVSHVMCATELQSGRQLFMSPKALYNYDLGVCTDLGSFSLARAVQASASLPMAFPPQVTSLAEHHLSFGLTSPTRTTMPVTDLAMVDGGVYDNMGDEWQLGYAGRVESWPDVEALLPPDDLILVANAGKALDPGSLKGLGRIRREITGLLRDQQIQYNQSTAPRRRALIDAFRATEAGFAGLDGVIVHIATSPRALCADVIENAAEQPVKAARAEQWVPLLDADRTAKEWAEMARRNAAVPTVLHALGRDATVDLVYHAAVLTRVNLHVHHGMGTVVLPDLAAIRKAVGS